MNLAALDLVGGLTAIAVLERGLPGENPQSDQRVDERGDRPGGFRGRDECSAGVHLGAHADFRQVTEDGLGYALAFHGIDDPGLAARLMDLYLTLDAYPEAAACLEALRAAGRKTAILSNGEPVMLGAAVGSAGLTELFDQVLSIEDAGIYKPDPRTYQLAVDRLEVPAERICFVSTNAWDAAGAAYFGFRVAWLNRFGLRLEELPGRPAAVIQGLDELPALLGG